MKIAGNLLVVLAGAAVIILFVALVNYIVEQDTRWRTRIAYSEWKRLVAADSAGVNIP